MFRFTIRDVLWLMVVLAFALCWYLERDGRIDNRERTAEVYRDNERLKQELKDAQRKHLRLRVEHQEALRNAMPQVTQ